MKSKKDVFNLIIKKNLYSKSYEEFLEQYSTLEKQVKLYDGMVDQKLYSKSKDEFLNQFFKPIIKNTVNGSTKYNYGFSVRIRKNEFFIGIYGDSRNWCIGIRVSGIR
jgi:hypothetical protein